MLVAFLSTSSDGNLFFPSVVQLGRGRPFVIGDELRPFERAAVLKICRDTGRMEGAIADFSLGAGLCRASADWLGADTPAVQKLAPQLPG